MLASFCSKTSYLTAAHTAKAKVHIPLTNEQHLSAHLSIYLLVYLSVYAFLYICTYQGRLTEREGSVRLTSSLK
jgi:hypothetical protein